MSGVEILATEKVASETIFNWGAFWITFGIIFVILLSLAIGAIRDKCINIGVSFIVVGLIAASVFGALIGQLGEKPVAYKNQYKVTISDEVSMNEFSERYEIIDQEGRIYTVEERED